jgi:hypothetical protein
MHTIHWGSMAAVLIMLQSPTSAKQASRQSSAATTTVVPLYGSGGRALAMLTLGDSPPAPVVFDTGTDENLIIESYARRLGLKVVGSAPMLDAATGKGSTVPVVALPTPRLSGVTVSPARAQRFKYNEPDMVGIFGPGSFSGQLVTLELDLNRLRLSALTPDNLPAGAATPYLNGLPALDIDVAGISLHAHLDSGADSDLTLPKSLIGKVPLKTPVQVIGMAGSVSGQQEVYGGQIDGAVRIGPLLLKDPQVAFIGLAGQANVGYKLLRHLTLVMDPKGQRSWVLDPNVGIGPLTDYAGIYPDREFRVAKGALIFERKGRAPLRLTPVGSDLFESTDTGDRVQFRRRDGTVVHVDVITANGGGRGFDRLS